MNETQTGKAVRMNSLSVTSPPPGAPANDGWAAYSRDDFLAGQVAAFCKQHQFACAVETGTWKGHTTVALAQLFPHVHTIEIDQARYEATLPRFEDYPNVTAHCGNSPDVLVRLVDEAPSRRESSTPGRPSHHLRATSPTSTCRPP